MSFVCIIQHGFVASTVAISNECIGLSVRKRPVDAFHLLSAIAVFGEEFPCHTKLAHIYFRTGYLQLSAIQYLRARKLMFEERTYPVLNARADHNHFAAFL